MLITGGTSGIGLAAARRAAEEGARVIVTGRDAGRGRGALAEIGGEALFLRQDVLDEAQWQEVCDEVVARCGRLDVLVNNAGSVGSGAPQNPEHMALAEWRSVVTLNLDSVFLGCRAAIAAMRRGEGGSIVNLSSTAAILGTPLIAAYGAAKAGVRQLTKSVAVYCARQGYRIRCNSIHPAIIETPLGDQIFHLYGPDPDEARAAYLQRVPLGSLGEPQDVAHAVVYLASDESRYVTGAELLIAGGLGV